MLRATTPGQQTILVEDDDLLFTQLAGGANSSRQIRTARKLRALLEKDGVVEYENWTIEQDGKKND